MLDFRKLWKKWHIVIQIIPFLALVLALKLLAHNNDMEIISLSALFTSIIAATIFLIGFLISGVISDYKESERIPTELAASLEVLHDEAQIIKANKKSKEADEFITFHRSFLKSLEDWFYSKERTVAILDKVSSMNAHFAKLESQTQPTFLVRMKQEQNNIRKLVIRTNNIRDLNFVESAYAVVEALIVLLLLGMVFMKVEPFYESMFFIFIVSFLALYMLFLIRDLDNPFDYKDYGENASEISLKPLRDLYQRLYGKT
ncbi:MAG: hypothetical protein PHF60_04200 [Candidatus ainarchaeum sp.]|nr:hypothetical protein [Candidatus ainarchaeum sp.]